MPREFIVLMGEQYPFGELGEVLTEDTRALVKKTLKISCEEQREIIRNMTHFLKVAKHQSLINLENIVEKKDEVYLFYEYAPFKLQKWIVTVNEDLLESLEEQMLELAQSLTRSSIKFSFDPDCLGLSKDMTVKYFLREFNLDFEGQEQHFDELRVQIARFFKQLSDSVPRNPESEYAKQCPRMESLSTNASISPLDDLISLTQSAIIKKNEDKTTKTSHISAKVESSMKKSLEALMRFKRMNSK